MTPQTFFTGNGDNRETLVVVFLRGGADGLSLVAPLEDDGYYSARPRLGIAKKEAVPLDGFFGMHPLLRDLESAWKEGDLAIVHGAGSEDETRSHFEAQDLMEHGGIVAGGWLGRFLRAKKRTNSSALSCVAVGPTLPECLLGAPSATAMESLDDFSLGAGTPGLRRELERLYALESDGLGSAARDTFSALNRIDTMRSAPYTPDNGAEYGTDGFSQGLRQVARLIKARVGLEAASLDLGGWDSHFTQGTLIEPLLTRLGSGLAAFRSDLGGAMAQTTVVVMTEFGRRVKENSAFGTDHGRGSVMWAMGRGVKGGRVIGPWPGLRDESLEGPGDLPVWNNYRNVLAPILIRHGAETAALARVFPDFELKPLDLYG
ncbi:DUF1501 domain-containing protein [Verrucomicrobiota bacterium sgz303538]